jgi:hypothetical protein
MESTDERNEFSYQPKKSITNPLCLTHGWPKPIFDYRESGLIVEFKANNFGIKTGGITPEISKIKV